MGDSVGASLCCGFGSGFGRTIAGKSLFQNTAVKKLSGLRILMGSHCDNSGLCWGSRGGSEGRID